MYFPENVLQQPNTALGNTNSFVVELWALRDELTMAKELWLNNLLVEMDAFECGFA